jgi:hypothetical protein
MMMMLYSGVPPGFVHKKNRRRLYGGASGRFSRPVRYYFFYGALYLLFFFYFSDCVGNFAGFVLYFVKIKKLVRSDGRARLP